MSKIKRVVILWPPKRFTLFLAFFLRFGGGLVITVAAMYRNGESKLFNGQLRYENLYARTKRQVRRCGRFASRRRPICGSAERTREASAIGLIKSFIARERVSLIAHSLEQIMSEFACNELVAAENRKFCFHETDYGLFQSAACISSATWRNCLKLKSCRAVDGLADGAAFILRSIPDIFADIISTPVRQKNFICRRAGDLI